MIPRRVLAYLGLFLVLLAVYVGLNWYQGRKETREAEAKKVFQIKEADITELTLKRFVGGLNVVLKDGEWFFTKPLKERAEKNAVETVLITLASMQKERDLGGEDLKDFGLANPALVVEFTAQGKKRKLTIGRNTPGDQGFYAYKDDDTGHVLVIQSTYKASIDRPLATFRDSSIFAFAPDRAKSLSIKTAGASVQLEKQAPGQWRWVGRENFAVRGDRVEELLRFLQGAKVKEFVKDTPRDQDLASYGLAPPLGEVAVVQDKVTEKALLGKKSNAEEYARKGPDGPIVVMNRNLLEHITKTLATLEDRRLWRGKVAEAQKVVWGPPEKTWVGVKEKDFVKITGPEKQELKQPAVLLEVTLLKMQSWEFIRLAPPKSPGAKPLYVLELMDGAGKPLLRLEELGPEGDKEVTLRVKVGDKTDTGQISLKAYQAWKNEIARLASPPPVKQEGPGKKK